jgi:hypothetical protein
MKRRLAIGALAVAMVMAVGGVTAAPEEEKPGEKAKAHGKRVPPGKGWEAFAGTFDADQDGKITKDEFKAKAPAFNRLDGDKNGTVTKAEVEGLPAAEKHPGVSKFISRFDTDGNGEVSKAEWDAKRAGAFDKADKDHDGGIDKQEAMSAGKEFMEGE